MISIEQIRNFFPPKLRELPNFERHAIREYIQLLILDFLSTSRWIGLITFIGGSNLRLVKGIDRFSEDLDFDCKELDENDFMEMTDRIIEYLNASGLFAVAHDKDSRRLTAYRRNIYFPELLFQLGLSGYREERFLIKVESQDQGIAYATQMTTIEGCGMRFPMTVPPDSVLLSMKLCAILARAKGRDFYDAMFLWQMTEPDFDFLSRRCGVADAKALLGALKAQVDTTDMNLRVRDFQQLLFDRKNADRIRDFLPFAEGKLEEKHSE